LLGLGDPLIISYTELYNNPPFNSLKTLMHNLKEVKIEYMSFNKLW